MSEQLSDERLREMCNGVIAFGDGLQAVAEDAYRRLEPVMEGLARWERKYHKRLRRWNRDYGGIRKHQRHGNSRAKQKRRG